MKHYCMYSIFFILILLVPFKCQKFYNVIDIETKKYCLGLEFSGAINIPYVKKTGEIGNYRMNIGKVDHTEGTCGHDEIQLNVDFHEITTPNIIWTFKMVFSKNNQTFKLSKFNLKGTLNLFSVIDIREQIDIDESVDVSAFETENNFMAYCESPTTVLTNRVFSFRMYDVSIVSFVQEDQISFFTKPYIQCSLDLSDTIYVLESGPSSYCFEMRGNFSFIVNYTADDNKIKKYTMHIPMEYSKRNLKGRCTDNKVSSFLLFKPLNKLEVDEFNFESFFLLEDGVFKLDRIDLYGRLHKSFIPDIKITEYFSESFYFDDAYTSHKENILSCSSKRTFNGNKDTQLNISDISVRTFQKMDSINFDGKRESCPMDEKQFSSKTGLIVGIVLGIFGLILIIIGGFFIKKIYFS